MLARVQFAFIACVCLAVFAVWGGSYVHLKAQERGSEFRVGGTTSPPTQPTTSGGRVAPLGATSPSAGAGRYRRQYASDPNRPGFRSQTQPMTRTGVSLTGQPTQVGEFAPSRPIGSRSATGTQGLRTSSPVNPNGMQGLRTSSTANPNTTSGSHLRQPVNGFEKSSRYQGRSGYQGRGTTSAGTLGRPSPNRALQFDRSDMISPGGNRDGLRVARTPDAPSTFPTNSNDTTATGQYSPVNKQLPSNGQSAVGGTNGNRPGLGAQSNGASYQSGGSVGTNGAAVNGLGSPNTIAQPGTGQSGVGQTNRYGQTDSTGAADFGKASGPIGRPAGGIDSRGSTGGSGVAVPTQPVRSQLNQNNRLSRPTRIPSVGVPGPGGARSGQQQPGASQAGGVGASTQAVTVTPPTWAGTLPAAHDRYVDQILAYWQMKTQEIYSYECLFRRWEWDTVFGPSHTYKKFSEGQIRYEKPDKGLFHVKTLKSYQPAQGTNPEKFAEVPGVFGEHWVCDGQKVYEYDYPNKRIMSRELPPGMRGKFIGSGPLPFLFGASAQEIKQRFWLRVITPATEANKPESERTYWLEAYPKRSDDAANYLKVVLIIDYQEYLPKGLMIFDRTYNPPANNNRIVFEFVNRKVKRQGSFLDNFQRPFYDVRPNYGWQLQAIELGNATTQGAPERR